MKKFRFFLAFLLPLAALIAGFVRHSTVRASSSRSSSAEGIPGSTNPAGFAVVELFTSEGCSSCPPAEKALAQLAGEYPEQVYPLEFHVDYWNRLGWKDIYSAAGYTQRQQQYAKTFNLESIYTPEAVVNGQKEFVGSDQSKLNAVVLDELSATTNISLGLTAESPEEEKAGSPEREKAGSPERKKAGSPEREKVVVHYNIKDAGSATTLQFALVQLHAASQVLRGENEGLHLQHINVVRDFQSVAIRSGAPIAGNAGLWIPDGLTAKDLKVIAFLQNKTGKIISAESTGIR